MNAFITCILYGNMPLKTKTNTTYHKGLLQILTLFRMKNRGGASIGEGLLLKRIRYLSTKHQVFAQIREGVGQGGSWEAWATLNGHNVLSYWPIFKI